MRTVTGDDALARLARLEELRTLEIAKQTGADPIILEPHQEAPGGSWYTWVFQAGRGSGKTLACAKYFDRFMRSNEGARGGIIAPTLGDAAESCVYGPSGLIAVNPFVRLRSRAGGTHAVWPNGSEAKLFGAYTKQDVERLRAGGNRHIFWAEELAAWRYLAEAWENMELGLRLGAWPHVVASSTPKPRPGYRKIVTDPETVVTRASIDDNPHLPAAQRTRLLRRYKGTRVEAQELRGELIEDVEGALWTYETIAVHRVVPADVPQLVRVAVAVDPSGGDEEGNSEQGIVVAGRGVDGHGYVLADYSCKLSPDGWGKAAVAAYQDHEADVVVGETNFGGDMVIFTVRVAARDIGVHVNVKKITASRGKLARAEPVSALYEQGKAHHVGEFPELESQQRTWTPDAGWSPDRLDALVWALTEVAVNQTGGLAVARSSRRRLPAPHAPHVGLR